MRRVVQAGVAAVAVGVSGCAVAPDGALVADPYAGINRSVHSFNKGVDQAVLRPAAQAYEYVAPELVKHLVGNAFDTLKMPGIFANNVLQGDVEGALTAAGRLGVNVAMGAGGLLDPATEFGLPLEPTDFGVTLATYGVEQGAYVELPLLGPSTVRDTVGRVVDMAFSPTTYLTGSPAVEIGYGARALEVIDVRAANANAIDEVLYQSADSYVAAQSAYIQLRNRQIAGGVTEDSLPDVFDE